MMFIRKSPVVGLTLFACLLSASARTVYDIPSLQADLGADPPHPTEFDLTVKVVLPCTPQNTNFYATDGTNTLMFVDKALWPALAFTANDLLHVKGQIRTSGLPDCLSISVMGKGPVEPIADLALGDLVKGRHDRTLVRVHGTVRNARQDEIDPNWAFVTLCDANTATQAGFMQSQKELSELHTLVDSEVSVVGIACSQHWQKSKNRQLTPASLIVCSLADFTVLRPAGDPFRSIPLDSGAFSLADLNGGRRRTAAGHVLAVYGGTHIVLRRDNGDILNVDLATDIAPTFGAAIRVAGYPATDLYRLNLTDAVWRPEPGAAMPRIEPTDVSLVDLLTDGQGRTMIKPTYHGQVIRIHGIVRTTENANGRFMVENDRSMIAVDAGQCPDVFGNLSPGCKVEVSGICVMPTDNWHPSATFPRIREVLIVLRTTDDLRILSRPPWWTSARLFALLAMLLTVLVAILVWNRLLKR